MLQMVAKDIEWEAAHRLVQGYPGKCQFNHGHSWKATITVQLADLSKLDQFGFVRDYADFKKVKNWVNDKWDHATMVSKDDKVFLKFLKDNKQKYFEFDLNPSSEIVAQVLFDKAVELLDDSRTSVVRVTINETCTSQAIFQI